MKHVIWIFLLLISSADIYGQCNKQTEYSSLRSLYLATDGDNWTNHSGWPSAATFKNNMTPPLGIDMNEWYGITCTLDTVTSVVLSNNNLRGDLPNLDLRYLELLYLDNNRLTGYIPDFPLPNLTMLNLSFNQLRGNIPAFYLPKLKSLLLNNNKLEGTIPYFKIHTNSFNIISLDNNNFSGCIDPLFKVFCQDNFSISGNPLLPWLGDFNQFCLSNGFIQSQIGSPCDNGNLADGNNDVIQSDCRCGVLKPCVYADECSQITSAQKISTTVTNPNCGGYQSYIIQGCLEGANPEIEISACDANNLPTVWFQIDVDDEAVQLVSQVKTNGSWMPVWSIYAGSCDHLTLVNGGTISSPIPCSNGDSNYDIHTIGIHESTKTYYIVVSGEGIIDDPSFELTAFTTAICIPCLGTEGCVPETKWTVEKRSSNRALTDPLFCPGEEVTICVDFEYDASQTAIDWFHGLIPDFGAGWDMDAFDASKVTATYGNPTWSDENDGLCAPTISEQIFSLCTYKDPLTGRLKLCHNGCQSCPCEGPLLAGSPLPSGWFWNTNGSYGCENDCSPSSHYGIGSVYIKMKFCVDLKVREFSNAFDCNINRSLHFNFQTTSHGVTGCWNDPVAECRLDYTQLGPNWNVDCMNPPRVLGDNSVLCNQGPLNIDLTNDEGNQFVTIEIVAIPNPNITGAKDYTFTNGSGTITDYLTNTSGSTQTQLYVAESKLPGFLCQGAKDTFKVTIYPNILVSVITFDILNDTICSGGNTEINVLDSFDNVINVVAIPNSFVSGSKNHNFNKSGIIDDKLVNSSNVVQIQQYELSTNKCTQLIDTIEIAILPIYTPRLLNKTFNICHLSTGIKANTIDFNTFGDLRYGRWLNLDSAPVDISDWTNVVFKNSNIGDSLLFGYERCGILDTFYYKFQVIDCACKKVPMYITQPRCGQNNGEITLTIDDSAYSYRWSNGMTGHQLTNLPTGNYQITVTSNDMPCIDTIDVLLFNGPAEFAIKAGGDIVTCKGNQTFLKASGPEGISYHWSNGGKQDEAFVPNKSGYYVVIGTDSFGCKAVDSLYITVLDDFIKPELMKDTLFVSEGMSYQTNLLLGNNIYSKDVSIDLRNIPTDYLEITSNDDKGKVTLLIKKRINATQVLTYEVCDPCDHCESGTLSLLDEQLRDMIKGNHTVTSSNQTVLQFTKNPIPGSELWIYNSLGQTVYHTQNYQNDWSTSGLPSGIYFYVFNVNGLRVSKALTVVR